MVSYPEIRLLSNPPPGQRHRPGGECWLGKSVTPDMAKHPLINTLLNLRGNVRSCVYTEPLWGIPYNLFAPYASVYMLALGLTDGQIGSLASIGLAFQVLWTMLGGAITDKLGRRRTTFIFDVIAWTIPCLLWAAAPNFYYFLAGAIINAVGRVTVNSWQCLLVEDTDPKLLVDVWSWVYIAGRISAFFAPLAGLFIARYSLVPTMRGIFLVAFVLMTAKFLIMYKITTETKQGLVRMRETARQSLFSVLQGYPAVLRQILRSPETLLSGGLLLILSICLLVNDTFWSVLVTEKLRIPAHHLAIYPFARSLTVLLFFFLIMPRLRRMDVRSPMLFGFLGLIASQVMLVTTPALGYLQLLAAMILEGACIPITGTLLDKLIVVSVDPQERARIPSILYVLVVVFTTPFGWIAGQLSEIDRGWPFGLSIALYTVGAALSLRAIRSARHKVGIGEA